MSQKTKSLTKNKKQFNVTLIELYCSLGGVLFVKRSYHYNSSLLYINIHYYTIPLSPAGLCKLQSILCL